MIKISVVPDTNVFISSLGIVESVLEYDFPWLCTLNISRTVLDELDFMKKSKPEARKAIRYIQSVALSLKVEIEGRIDDRKIDVEIEYKDSVREKSNDDKILNYAFKLENPVLITNDVSFGLRCSSFNVPVVSAKENNTDLVISRILECFGVQVRAEQQACEIKEPVASSGFGIVGLSLIEGVEDLDRFRSEFKSLIEPVIFRILHSEVGDNFIVLLSESSPEYYLQFIVSNYSIFKSYFPKNCCSVIEKFLIAMRNKNLKQIISNARVLLVAFGYLPTNG